MSGLIRFLMLGAIAQCAVESVTLEWNDVSLSIVKKGKERNILEGISGAARPGRLLAIMGPSGSGKSSLLLALAGQVSESSRGAVRLSGELLVDGSVVADGNLAETHCDAAFVKQDDLFYSQMTVKETLMFAARLRLPRTTPLEEKKALVDALMQKLNLVKCADTPVGDAKVHEEEEVFLASYNFAMLFIKQSLML
jgi:ABC-type multidrug transport system ATPase subunit